MTSVRPIATRPFGRLANPVRGLTAQAPLTASEASRRVAESIMTEHEAIRIAGPPDFEAEVRFLIAEEGGRTGRGGPVRQGYLCDVHWDDDSSDVVWMIWPAFLDESGQ